MAAWVAGSKVGAWGFMRGECSMREGESTAGKGANVPPGEGEYGVGAKPPCVSKAAAEGGNICIGGAPVAKVGARLSGAGAGW